MSAGIILLGHGSRRAEANDEIREIARMVAGSQPEYFYETAFLSMARPDLAEAVAKFVHKGITRIIVAPIFLVTGDHIARDIPEKIDKLKVIYPDVEFVITGHIGPHPGIAAIVKERIQEAPGQN